MKVLSESIFRAALRSFCRVFFSICGFFLAIFVFTFIYSASSGGSLVEQKTTMTLLPDAAGRRELVAMSAPAILQLNVHGVIGDPRLATAAKGELLLDAASVAVSRVIELEEFWTVPA